MATEPGPLGRGHAGATVGPAPSDGNLTAPEDGQDNAMIVSRAVRRRPPRALSPGLTLGTPRADRDCAASRPGRRMGSNDASGPSVNAHDSSQKSPAASSPCVVADPMPGNPDIPHPSGIQSPGHGGDIAVNPPNENSAALRSEEESSRESVVRFPSPDDSGTGMSRHRDEIIWPETNYRKTYSPPRSASKAAEIGPQSASSSMLHLDPASCQDFAYKPSRVVPAEAHHSDMNSGPRSRSEDEGTGEEGLIGPRLPRGIAVSRKVGSRA